MSLQLLFNILIFGWALCKQEDLLNQPTEGWNKTVEFIRKNGFCWWQGLTTRNKWWFINQHIEMVVELPGFRYVYLHNILRGMEVNLQGLFGPFYAQYSWGNHSQFDGVFQISKSVQFQWIWVSWYEQWPKPWCVVLPQGIAMYLYNM